MLLLLPGQRGRQDALSGEAVSEDVASQSLDALALLLDIEKRDPLSEISEQEKELLCKFRNLCRDMPNILPRLLGAVKWQARDEVSQLYLLLASWAQFST